MPLFEPTMTRRRALCLAGLSVPALLLPAVAAQSQPTPMLTRAIPRTGEAMPVVGLGTAAGFEAGADDATKRAQLAAVLQALVAGGGKLVDTASSYGSARTRSAG